MNSCKKKRVYLESKKSSEYPLEIKVATYTQTSSKEKAEMRRQLECSPREECAGSESEKNAQAVRTLPLRGMRRQ
jgi:hypothetical protein